MSDSIDPITLKSLKIAFWGEIVKIVPLLRNFKINVIT